jgi:hypothetical protein
MGTRHLIVVIKGGTHKIAQYGQWDGYPSGQGATVLEFCRTMDRSAFAAKVTQCRFLTEAEMIARWAELGVDVTENGGWVSVELADRHKARWPELSRDTGAEILAMVAASESGLALEDAYAFANDGIFCEYAYVIDLDAGQLEAYKGFCETPHEGQRFSGGAPQASALGGQYCPVALAASWPLDNLPTQKAFEAAIDQPEDEEEAA